jgi:cysteine desulfurase
MHALFSKKRIYLDYAAATPVDREVMKAMKPYWTECFGNAGGIHEEGRFSKKILTDSRNTIAQAIGVRSEEIIFTASGTEGNNLAIFGYINALREKGTPYEDMHAVVLSAEHPSVLDCFKSLEKEGVSVSYVTFNERGILEPQILKSVLTPKTRLVSIGYVNNEIGTIQPIGDIAKVIRAYEKEQHLKTSICFHTDASQAPLYLNCTPTHLGVDLMTIDGQKIYGPKGVGCLYKKESTPLTSLMKGGNQEFRLRPGTENIPLIVGLAVAFTKAVAGYEIMTKQLTPLRDYFISQALEKIPGAILNGHPTMRVANNINISIPGFDNEYLVVLLDEQGIAAATKSACLGYSTETHSYVVSSLTGSEMVARSSLRFTMGKYTTMRDIDRTVSALTQATQKLDRVVK